MSKQRDNKSKGKTSGKGSDKNKGRNFVKGHASTKKKMPQKSTSNPDQIRLNKYIANSGICSRRDADMHISIGSVTVNGKVITEMGFKVKLDDEVRFDGARQQAKVKGER
jgi:23S rRNA pseudouridine2605 synthase